MLRPRGTEPRTAPVPAAGVRRAVLLALAALFFGLAVLGAFLPVLPTTPFLLVTSWLLVRSSPRLHQRLRASRLFGGFLRDWEEHRGVRPHVKVTALVVMAAVVVLSATSGTLPPALFWI